MGKVKTDVNRFKRKYRNYREISNTFINDAVYNKIDDEYVNIGSIEYYSGRFYPGKVYAFDYLDPITSPDWWDMRPCVLAIGSIESNDFGINLNLIPKYKRLEILDLIHNAHSRFIEKNKNSNAVDQDWIRSMIYDNIKPMLKSMQLDFALRQYIPNRKRNQRVLSYNTWYIVAAADLLELNGLSRGKLNILYREFYKR